MKRKNLLMMLGVIVSLMSWNCDGNAKSDNVLGVKVPKIEKFVRVTTDEGADIFKSASADSPWRVIWLGEDEEDGRVQVDETWSDVKVPSEYTAEKSVEYTGDCLPLLGEDDDFWKVYIYKDYAPDLEVGYIRKSDAEVVPFEPITADMIQEQGKLSPTVLKTEGKFAGLVMDVGSDEEWGEEWIDVGVLVDGMIVAPETSMVSMMRDDEVKEVEFVYDKKEDVVRMRYPESMMKEDEEGLGSQWFDPAKLTDQQIEQMLKALGQKKKSEWVKCECRIPMGDGSRQIFRMKN